jgi:hypothetical protein
MSNSKLRVPRLGRTSVFAAVASAAILLAPADGPLGGLLSSAAAQDGAGGQAGGREGGRGQRMQDGGQGGQRGGRGGMGGFGGRGGRMGGMGGGMRDVRELMEPDFLRRDVPLFVSQLELDDTQTLVVETLMGDYESDYATASGRVTEQMAEMGRQMFSNMVTPEMRTRFEDEARSIREEIREMQDAAGGELDPEQIRNMWRERMGKLQQEIAAEQGDNGMAAQMQATMGEMFARLQEWQAKKAAMRVAFVDGLKIQLTDEQNDLWPAFERFLIREKSLPKARLSGEGLNLFLIVDEAELPEESLATLDPILDEYEVVLDQAIRRRDEVVATTSAQMYRAIQEGDTPGAMRTMERQMQARTALRDVNELYRARLVAELGDSSDAKSLNQAILESGFERIYQSTPTARAFAAALGIDGLDASVLEAVLATQAAFEAEMAARNDQLLALTKRFEPQQQLDEAERFVAAVSGMMAGGGFNPGGFGPGPENPMRESMETRGELDRQYRDRLEALLTPEQVEQLPSTRRGRGGAGGGQFAEMREQALQRFDKDGDGELSQEERREMMETFRQEGFPGRGQGGGGGGQGGGRGQGGRGQGQGS